LNTSNCWGSELRMSNEGTAYNRAYLASAIAFAKIPLRGTSDMLGTLYAINLKPSKIYVVNYIV